MRILLTGSKGQLGQSIRKRLPEDWELIATDSKTLDITDHEAVLKMVESFQPDAVVNTAAYMAVGKAAEDVERVFAVNASGTRNLAQAAFAVGAKFVHISTDYVFGGGSRIPYSEIDPPTGYGGAQDILGIQRIRPQFHSKPAAPGGRAGRNPAECRQCRLPDLCRGFGRRDYQPAAIAEISARPAALLRQ